MGYIYIISKTLEYDNFEFNQQEECKKKDDTQWNQDFWKIWV